MTTVKENVSRGKNGSTRVFGELVEWSEGENGDLFKNLIIDNIQNISPRISPIASLCPCVKLILAFLAEATYRFISEHEYTASGSRTV